MIPSKQGISTKLYLFTINFYSPFIFMEDFDVGAVATSILSLAIYHIYTYSSVFCLHNENIQLSRNISNSFYWIQKHRAYADAASTTLAGKPFPFISINV